MPNKKPDSIKLDKTTSEMWFLARILQDPLFANTIRQEYDTRWVKSKLNSLATKIIFSFNSKYKRAMSIPEFKMLLDGIANKDQTISKESCDKLVENMSDVIKNVQTDMLADITNDFVRRQATWCAIVDNVNDIEQNPDATIDKCINRLNDIHALALDSVDAGMNYFDDAEFDEHFDAISNPSRKLSTGWPTIDEITHGGFYQNGRCLVLVAGQAGLGKSLCLSNLAVNFLNNDKVVVVISLEMSENVYAQRFDAHISNIDINSLADNGNQLKSRLQTFKMMHPGAKLFIKEFPPHAVSSVQIDRYLKELTEIKGVKPDVLIVDYLNLVRANSETGDNMYLEGKAVSEQLRELSYKYEIPVVSAVQVNSAGMNNANAGMENISESRGIVMTCDYLQLLTQSEEDQQNGIIRMKILKNRFGGDVGRKVPFKLDPHTLVFTDLGGQNVTFNGNSKSVQKATSQTTSTSANIDTDDIDSMLDLLSK